MLFALTYPLSVNESSSQKWTSEKKRSETNLVAGRILHDFGDNQCPISFAQDKFIKRRNGEVNFVFENGTLPLLNIKFPKFNNIRIGRYSSNRLYYLTSLYATNRDVRDLKFSWRPYIKAWSQLEGLP